MAFQPLSPAAQDPEVMLDINTTPLIDVMLVLLIMFIVTIPSPLDEVKMDLPVHSAQRPPTEPVVIRLEIDASNQIRWNGQVLARAEAELEARFQTAAQSSPQPELHLRAHPQARYGRVARVLSMAEKQGLQKIGILGLDQYGP